MFFLKLTLRINYSRIIQYLLFLKLVTHSISIRISLKLKISLLLLN